MSDDPIHSIFFERQQAALCAQHALNMLLQDSLFTYENLRDLARQMDKKEHELLGNNADAIGKSQNMNDSGFFSIQVIEKALEAFDLKLTNIENPVMSEYKTDPLTARAYVCNLREHWFILRKFGNQWFELNSINRGPRLLSDTYVREFLHQLSAEGYSIFVVQGILPSSEADNLISLVPVEVKTTSPTKKPTTDPPNMVQKFFNSVGKRLGGTVDTDTQEERDMAIAMAMSMETTKDSRAGTSGSSSSGGGTSSEEFDEEEAIRKAISMSLQGDNSEGSKPQEATQETPSESSTPVTAATSDPIETPILGAPSTSESVTMTSESSQMTSTSSGIIPSPEQQRRDRQKFLERLEKKNQSEE